MDVHPVKATAVTAMTLHLAVSREIIRPNRNEREKPLICRFCVEQPSEGKGLIST
jgi:hypothetical protein